MGWLIVIDIKGLYKGVDMTTLVLLVCGGLSYTSGCIFFAKDNWRYNHSIWHIFVMLGSIFHYFAIMKIV